MNPIMYSSKSDLWETPQEIYDALDKEFGFMLDACALPENAKCERYYTPTDNGLIQPWCGTVWCNPPYGRDVVRWVAKAAESAKQGATVVMLLPARTDTRWFHELINGHAEVRFIKGRLKFGGSKNSAPFPSMIVIFKDGMKGDKKMNYAIDKTQKYPYLDGMYRLCKDGVGIGWIGEGARIGKGAWIGKCAWIGEGAVIGEGAEIKSIYDYMTVGGIGSRQAITTFYRCKDGLIRVNCGCFNGTLDEFEAAVHETHAGNEHEKAYMAAIRMAKEIMIHD